MGGWSKGDVCKMLSDRHVTHGVCVLLKLMLTPSPSLHPPADDGVRAFLKDTKKTLPQLLRDRQLLFRVRAAERFWGSRSRGAGHRAFELLGLCEHERSSGCRSRGF